MADSGSATLPPSGRIHLAGAGGAGMAGLAMLLKARGFSVSGCDPHPSARTRFLASCGIPVSDSHSAAHLDGADALVATPAIPRSEPELAAAAERGIPLLSRGEALAQIVNAAPYSIAVCGSHGKTTTATWIARLLAALGENVEWCIGGESAGFPVAGATPGAAPQNSVLVVEADESDGTLALYRPSTLVVTNCEYDHADHFATADEYRACFERAEAAAGAVIRSEALPTAPALEDALRPLAPHNAKNARAAAEAALRRGHSMSAVAAALPAVVSTLPDRRFQRLDYAGHGAVFADYAHHPTEIACAVAMARRECSGVLRILFQPHRYSRTKALLASFPAAFAEADELVVCPTYAAFEEPVEGGDSADLYAACRAAGSVSRLFLARTCEEAWEHAANSMRDGDLTLLLGAGDIIGLAPHIAAWTPPATRRIFIGAGSNTWKSDLNLSVEYVRTKGPAGRAGATLKIPWMAGIPGTIGGWIKMNAGAFGHSISEALAAVEVDGRWIAAEECGFSYRHSSIEGEISDFRLKEGFDPGPETAEAYLARRKKFPAGTYGSFFKNPPGDFAGRLLEGVGAKGMRVGGAYVWEEHANVIVRGEGATSSDVLALAGQMRRRVLLRTGVALSPEVCGVVL